MLSYIKHAFYRIDNLKTIFVKYKFKNTVRDKNDEDEMHFNNFNVITHYEISIQLYDNVQDFDTVYEKAAHKFLLKIFFVMTNKVND